MCRWPLLPIVAIVPDDERRYRVYGLLNGIPHCLTAVLRNSAHRAISFRRAHSKVYTPSGANLRTR